MKTNENGGDFRAICIVGALTTYLGRLKLKPGFIEARSNLPFSYSTVIASGGQAPTLIWAVEVRLLTGVKRLMVRVAHERQTVFAIPMGIASERMIELLRHGGFIAQLEVPPRWLPRYFGFVWLYFIVSNRFRKDAI